MKKVNVERIMVAHCPKCSQRLFDVIKDSTISIVCSNCKALIMITANEDMVISKVLQLGIQARASP